MQNLKPTIDNIKRLYGDDKDKVQRETTALYEKAGVKPLAGEAITWPADCHSHAFCAGIHPVCKHADPTLAACTFSSVCPGCAGSLLCPFVLCWHWLLVPSCSCVDDCTGSTVAVVWCRLPALAGHHPHLHWPVPVPVQCGQQWAARHRGLLLAALPCGTHHIGSTASRWAHLRAEGAACCICAKQAHAALRPQLCCI